MQLTRIKNLILRYRGDMFTAALEWTLYAESFTNVICYRGVRLRDFAWLSHVTKIAHSYVDNSDASIKLNSEPLTWRT